MPAVVAADLAEHGIPEFEQRRQRDTLVQILEYRREVARHAAVQRIVIDGLVVRLIGHQARALTGAVDGVGGVPALSVAAAIGHVLVLLEMVPAVQENGIAAHRGTRDNRQQLDRTRRFDEQIIIRGQTFDDIRDGQCRSTRAATA